MGKNKTLENNGLENCLKIRQHMEVCQNKQKKLIFAKLSAELSTGFVDRFFLVYEAIVCSTNKNHVKPTHV